MKIVHLLSQNHLTGAEVYAVTLAQQQIQNGHQVWQISNGFFYPTDCTKVELAVETKSKWAFLASVQKLNKFLKENDIDVIHAHSRAASKLAHWARKGTKAALVSTVHGRQHHSFSKRLFNHYGELIIAVCENIKTHLNHDFKYSMGKIKVVRNPVSASQFQNINLRSMTEPLATQIKIGIIGRTTGPKGFRTEQAIRNIFTLADKLNFKAEITLVGGHIDDLALISEQKELIQVIQVQALNSQIYQTFDLTLGSGRVCMESLLSGVPTIAFGEAQYVGLIRRGTLDKALESNFGDIDDRGVTTPTLNLNQLQKDLEAFLQNEMSTAEIQDLSERAQILFSTDEVVSKIQRIYESARLIRHYPKWIPVLMYHKIPEAEIQSQHKIYVTKDNFKNHLQFYKSKGFETITFDDLQLFRKGHKSLAEFPRKPLILTFDDGYKDNLQFAAPLLKEFNMKAQIFLLAEPEIGSNTWDQTGHEPAHEIVSGKDRQKWITSPFDIGSHGFSHKKITEMSETEALNELLLSKKALESELGRTICCFAFTYGLTHKEGAGWAEKAGYDYAVNTDSGGLHIEEEPYSVFRVNIFPDETSLSLWKKTSSWYRNYYFSKRGK